MDGTDEQLGDRAVIERFARAVIAGDAAFAVMGRDGIASVPSKDPTRGSLDLLWSSRAEALRWADALTENPEIIALDTASLLDTYLPAMAGAGRKVGADWSDGPDEAEFDPDEILSALRDAALAEFDDAVAADRHVWLLRLDSGAGGHAVLTNVHARLAVPVFATREDAQAAARELWPDAVAVGQSIGEFTQRTLYAGIEHKLVYAPGFVAGRPTHVLMPWDIKGRLQSLLRREVRAVA